MKNKRYFYDSIKIIVFLFAVFLNSCEPLDEPEPGALNPEYFFYSQDDAISAVTAAYAPLYGGSQKYYPKMMVVLCGVGSDNMGDGFGGIAERKEMDRFKFDPKYADLSSVWWNAYIVVNRAGFAVKNIEGMDDLAFDSPELKQRLIAEARVLRAHSYFNLIRLFGAVPFYGDDYVSDPVNSLSIKRTNVDEIYRFIIEDVKKAEPHLWGRAKVEAGRVNKATAQILLSKMYLTWAGWRLDAFTNTMVQGGDSCYTQAAVWSKKLIDSGVHGLRDNYREVFPSSEDEYQFENNEEHIWFMPCSKEKQGWEILLYWGPKLANGEGAYSSFVGEVEFTSSFEEDDLREPVVNLHYIIDEFEEVHRLDESSAGYFWPGMNIPHPGKYLPEEEKYEYPPQGNVHGANIQFFRFAEALLIHAEAENEKNVGPTAEGIESFNKIRRRAGLSEWPDVKDLNGNIYPNSYEGFRAAVRQEWRWELCYEFKRLFDLRRWGILEEVFLNRAKAPDATSQDLIRAQNIQKRHNLFPIPHSEILKNPNLTQNPGY